MKKIIFLIYTLLSFAVYSQEPTHTKKPKTFQPGNWYMVGNWDSTAAAYKDTIGYYLEGDTIYHWANKQFNNIGSYTYSGGNFYGSNHGWYCGFDTLFEGGSKTALIGRFTGTLSSGTYQLNGMAYVQDIDVNYYGYKKVVSGINVKSSFIYADTNNISIAREINGTQIGYVILDTGHLWLYNSSGIFNQIMSADSGGNHFKIYVPTITKNLTVHGIITSGGLINKDTVISLIDDATFNFPTASVGWAEIQCDSSGYEKTWGNVSWNGDGATNLRSYGAKFVNTDIDGNYACFYDGGSYAILKNTSGSTKTYSIKYHYHQ